MAARTFQSKARSVRTFGLEIYGVAKGLDGQNVPDSYGQIVQWAHDGKLIVAVERTALSEIETAWQTYRHQRQTTCHPRTTTSRLVGLTRFDVHHLVRRRGSGQLAMTSCRCPRGNEGATARRSIIGERMHVRAPARKVSDPSICRNRYETDQLTAVNGSNELAHITLRTDRSVCYKVAPGE